MPKDQIYNLPNMLSLVRIISIPMIIVLSRPGPGWGIAAAVVFALASVTDFFDGFLARKFGSITNLGRFLDPMADKLLVSAALIMLVSLDRCPAWVAWVIIGREIAVTGLRAAAAASVDQVIVSAGIWGKIKVVFQIPAILGLFIQGTYYGINFGFYGCIFLYIALALTLFSGWVYFKQYWALIIKPGTPQDA